MFFQRTFVYFLYQIRRFKQLRVNQEVHKRNSTTIRSTTLAVKLGWDYHSWSGVPIEDLLSVVELKELEEGKLSYGMVTLEELLRIGTASIIGESVSKKNEEGRFGRKRDATDESPQENVFPKMPRVVEEENGDT
ncbi:hypothetical protein COOONC_03494 [Cooperia oncophora]